MTREYLQDKINQLIRKPWITEGDLMSIHTILIGMPFSGGNIQFMIADLAQHIDMDLKEYCIQKEGKENVPRRHG